MLLLAGREYTRRSRAWQHVTVLLVVPAGDDVDVTFRFDASKLVNTLRGREFSARFQVRA